MNYTIRSSQSADAEMASALVQQSFIQLVGPDWEQHAVNTFLAETSGNCLRDLISKAAFTAVAEVQGRLVGFILMPSPALIGLLFVKPNFLRNGIAKSLWQAARRHIETTCKEVKTVELNSTPYAVAAYRALGFYPISEPFRRGGCLATRMACWLPGDALQALANQVNEPHC
jgi:GNAT superfamily N-acetyltransferase